MSQIDFLTGGGEELSASPEHKKLDEILHNCPENVTIRESFIKAYSKINDPKYKTILVSVSGGSDSDVVIDICERVRERDNLKYIWFDTGIEYKATKEHIKYLEKKYGIEIIRFNPIKTIPKSCREFGQPFISKYVSEQIMRLQRHGFQWEDEPYEDLIQRYPKCTSALRWWGSVNTAPGYKSSWFSIDRHRFLKDFIIQNPPQFNISTKCCTYAKKNVAHQAYKEYGCDLDIIGVRKAEGGVRATNYHNCFSEGDICDHYRPIFWYKDADKAEYDKYFHIEHSRCYSEYGFKRTGCVGCPFNKHIIDELKTIEEYEPGLYKAVSVVFKDSYEYTKKYRDFVKQKKSEEKEEECSTKAVKAGQQAE